MAEGTFNRETAEKVMAGATIASRLMGSMIQAEGEDPDATMLGAISMALEQATTEHLEALGALVNAELASRRGA